MSDEVILLLASSQDAELAMLSEVPAGFTVVRAEGDSLPSTSAQASIILAWSASRDLLRAAFLQSPQLKWIHSRSAGLDTILFPELLESPVILTNGTGVFSASLGEFAVAAILYFAKDFRRMIRNQEAGVWEPFDVESVSGKTLGVVGYGDIGRAVASRAQALGMRVLAVKRDPTLSERDRATVDAVYTPDRLKEMMPQCDYVVVSAPLTEQTRGLVGAEEIAALRSSAVIVNVGRGPVIDENALVQALSAGAIRGAALDVFDQEPLPGGHPFYGLRNVLLSPHCADHLPHWKKDAMVFFLDQLDRYRTGASLKNVVDKSKGY